MHVQPTPDRIRSAFRHLAAEATGVAEAVLEASAVSDPYASVETDVEPLLAAPQLSRKVSVSGHVCDVSTGRVATAVDARFPSSRPLVEAVPYGRACRHSGLSWHWLHPLGHRSWAERGR